MFFFSVGYSLWEGTRWRIGQLFISIIRGEKQPDLTEECVRGRGIPSAVSTASFLFRHVHADLLLQRGHWRLESTVTGHCCRPHLLG